VQYLSDQAGKREPKGISLIAACFCEITQKLQLLQYIFMSLGLHRPYSKSFFFLIEKFMKSMNLTSMVDSLAGNEERTLASAITPQWFVSATFLKTGKCFLRML